MATKEEIADFARFVFQTLTTIHPTVSEAEFQAKFAESRLTDLGLPFDALKRIIVNDLNAVMSGQNRKLKKVTLSRCDIYTMLHHCFDKRCVLVDYAIGELELSTSTLKKIGNWLQLKENLS